MGGWYGRSGIMWIRWNWYQSEDCGLWGREGNEGGKVWWERLRSDSWYNNNNYVYLYRF
jgi:hypothetical protein